MESWPLCTERHIGLSEAVNELARAGLSRTPFRQRMANVGLKGDVTDVAATLELLDHHDCDHP